MSHSLIGKKAPSFSLPNYDGATYTYSPEQLGIPSVVFFYPNSGAYGCVKEACAFRDAMAERESFKTDKALIVAISGDPIEKQKEFVTKHELTYPVLSDTKHEVRNLYHVGKIYLGLSESRVTFVVDNKGVVRDSYDSTLKYGAHMKFASKWLEKLEAETPQITSAAPPAQAGAGPTRGAPEVRLADL